MAEIDKYHINTTENLLFYVDAFCKRESTSRLRGVEAFWDKDFKEINLIFYYNSPQDDDLEENLLCIAIEVIAEFSVVLFKDSYTVIESDTSLPEGKQWGYLSPHEKTR